ncbi:MAG: hypothetical protein ACJ8EB_01535 [Allosphingosinicella sp.]
MRLGEAVLAVAVAVAVGMGLAATAAAGQPAPGAGESLALSASSWGKPLFDWRVSADGEAVYRSSVKVPGGAFRDYDLVTRRFRLGRAELARLRRLLAPGRRYAGTELPCRGDMISDMPYGRIAWGSAELKYDLGCRSPETKPVHRGLEAARELMERLAAKAPVASVEPVRG